MTAAHELPALCTVDDAASALAMELARETGAVVTGLRRGRNTLEEIFLEAVGEKR